MNWKKYVNLLGPVLALLFVYGLFAAVAPGTFASLGNLDLMLRQSAVVGTAAIGMTVIIIAGGIDLSVGSMVALSSVVIALLLKEGYSPLTAAVGGVAVAAIAGTINGGLVTSLRVVPFIVTLGTLLIYRGVAKWVADESTINPERTWLKEIMAQVPPERAWMVLAPGVTLMLLLAAAMSAMLHYTRLGRHIYAVGSNEATARLCGIRVAWVKVCVYAIGGFATGMAGLMHFSRLYTGDPTSAQGLELDIIAAVVIGGGSLSGGEGSMLGALVGALIMTVIRSGCTQIGLPNYTQEIITGVIIVVAVALDRLRHRRTG